MKRPSFFRFFPPVIIIFSFLLLPSAIFDVAGQSAIAQVNNDIFIPLILTGKPATGGDLVNGGVLDGPNGVSIAAPDGSLATPLHILFTSLEPPNTALPAAAQAVGAYLHISATETTYLSPNSPLVLGFPPSPGADTSHLALAVLKSGANISDVYSQQSNWTFLEGLYDATQDLFLTTNAALTAQGETYVLVEHPGYASPTNPPAAQPSPARTTALFNVKCVNFTNTTDCTPAIQSQVAALLVTFEDHLQGDLGFEPPRLLNLLEKISITPPVAVTTAGYTAYIEPHDYGFCGSDKAAGYYNAEQARLVLCLNPAIGIDTEYERTLLHEYFHATEFAYAAVMLDRSAGKQMNWIIEGMANASEESFYINTMKRSEIGGWIQLHKVDLPLDFESDLDVYFAQDFWVYYGQQYGQNLSYLQAILNLGAETRDVAAALGAGDYLETYWPWAKNQAIEATNTLDNALKTPCQLETQVVQQPSVFNYVFGDLVLSRHEVTVPPLTTVVVEIHFDFNYDIASGWVYPTNPDQYDPATMALEYKFYKEGENGCDQVPEKLRNYLNVQTADVYYVLIANKDIANTWDYTVAFEVSPIPGP